MLVTYGSEGEGLARAVASLLGVATLAPERRRFPDGEQYLLIPGDVRGKDVAVFQSLAFRPDQLLFEYCLMVDALKGGGARSVVGVIPYLAYARQDRVFHPNEPLSARLIPRIIESAGTDRVITVDMHLHRFREAGEVFSIPVQNLTAMPMLARYYKGRHRASGITVVGPDRESEQWVATVAAELAAPSVVLKKERLGDMDVKVMGELPLGRGTALVVDDMVSTGRTMIEVISRLRKEGVQRVDALVSHALLVGDAAGRMREAGLRALISTDTVPGEASCVSVAPLLAEALRKSLD